MENSGDAEPTEADDGEALGWSQQPDQSQTMGRSCAKEGEPELGWTEQHGAGFTGEPCSDREAPGYPASADRAIIEAARERYTAGDCTKIRAPLAFTATDPETGRVGKWLLQRAGFR